MGPATWFFPCKLTTDVTAASEARPAPRPGGCVPGSQPKATGPCPFSGCRRGLSGLVSPWMAERPPHYTFPHKAIDTSAHEGLDPSQDTIRSLFFSPCFPFEIIRLVFSPRFFSHLSKELKRQARTVQADKMC